MDRPEPAESRSDETRARRSSVRLVPVAVLTALAGVLASCGGDEPRAPTACGGSPFDPAAVSAYDPAAPPYGARGLHPVVLADDSGQPVDRGGPPDLPHEWVPRDGELPELIVCQYQNPVFQGTKVGSCRYESGPTDNPSHSVTDVLSARWVYRVFEARTDRLVDQFTLPGSAAPESSCPSLALVGGYRNQLVASAQLARRLLVRVGATEVPKDL